MFVRNLLQSNTLLFQPGFCIQSSRIIGILQSQIPLQILRPEHDIRDHIRFEQLVLRILEHEADLPFDVAAAYLVLYGIGRFAVEFLRNDYRGSVGVLSTSQLISIGAVIGGIVLYFVAPKLAGVGNVAEEKSVG